jgi:hypothetical protein
MLLLILPIPSIPYYFQTLLGGASLTKTECQVVNGVGNVVKIQTGFFNENKPIILSPNDIETCNGLTQPVMHVIKINKIKLP